MRLIDDGMNAVILAVIQFASKIFSYIVGQAPTTFWGKFVATAILLILIFLSGYLLLAALEPVLEQIGKIVPIAMRILVALGLRSSKKEEIRRRAQFCRVLWADLSTLAKAENWNDQYFTDQEAEVETEGAYYASWLERLLRRRSRGLRKVRSLMQAIKTGAEQVVLLVGEPGSGKSVALRHLATQFAEHGARTSAETTIPLYVNLREIGPCQDEKPTADFIKQFVLENIRRGDADTAAYVRENWDNYRTQGRWFFLFDSFDEIPAVLHAPTDSEVIRQHAEVALPPPSIPAIS
jgi:hypothetical protein